MKKLYPKQAQAVDFFANRLQGDVVVFPNTSKNTLDSSSVGTGKTVVACHLAKRLKAPCAVICPKSVIPSWEREMEEVGIKPEFILNYEKIRTGNTPHLHKVGKKIMTWNLPKDTIVFVDEIHKAKGPYTQNAQLIISLVGQGYRVHGMGATACEDPTEMRAIGYMLGLHSLQKDDGGKRSWYGWMKAHGCYVDDWGQWRSLSRKSIASLHKDIYGVSAHKLTVTDFPDSFKENRVFVEPIQFADTKKIIKAYDDLGITPAIVEAFIEDRSSLSNNEHVIVNILRARQIAESFKVPDLAEMAQELIGQGNSVVLFVNFKESVDALCAQLKCGRIDGGQSGNARQKNIDDFQADETHAIVVNVAAGGTGVSLHDTHGNRPRVSLISPSFSAKDHLQTLGRIHRNGAKSDALQKIMVAVDSIEENVMKSIDKKIKNMEALHG